MSEPEKSILVCMSCMTPNDASDSFCQNCRSPLGETNSLDPMQSIRDEGALLRKAASGQPRFIVPLGMWILFLPWLIIVVFLETALLYNWDGFFSYIFFLAGIALFIFPVVLLYNVTKNYLKARDEYQASLQKQNEQTENRLRAKAKRQAKMKSNVR